MSMDDCFMPQCLGWRLALEHGWVAVLWGVGLIVGIFILSWALERDKK